MRFRKTLTFFILATGLALALSAWAQQKNVGPSSAGPRPNAVRPYVACAAAMPALPPRAQQKPFTEEQVSNMVRDGFGDESGAKLIEQRGIDFAPSEDFIQTLKAAVQSSSRISVHRGEHQVHGDLRLNLCGKDSNSPRLEYNLPINSSQSTRRARWQ